ncbi:MAG: TetR/AcrR family transcriptional regulator [Spirochaeta sp.]
MGVKERRDRQKQELRRLIITAAGNLVAKHGHEQLTMRSLAKAIEYSPRTVYLHFKDKDALLQGIVEYGFESTLELQRRKPKHDQLPPETRMRERLRAHIETALANANMYRVIVSLMLEKNHPPGPAQRQILKQVNTSLMEFAPEASHERIDTAVLVLMSSLRGFTISLINAHESGQAMDPSEFIDHFVEFAVNGLRSTLTQ